MEKVPKREIEKRVTRFQSVLRKCGVDGAFILQNVDIFYFSGTIQSSILFIPQEGPPLLMVKKSYQRARDESQIEELIQLNHRGEIPSILERYGYGDLNFVGLEMDVVPTNQYLWYQKNFTKCKWIDISSEIRKLRMIKSPYEIEQIRRAALALDKGFNEIKGIIREGMSELEIDGQLFLLARRNGHMGILRMRGWNQEMIHAHVLSGVNGSAISFCDTPTGGTGITPAMAQGAGFRRIKKNEPIAIDYGLGINGYVGDEFRTFVIGKLQRVLEEAHECS